MNMLVKGQKKEFKKSSGSQLLKKEVEDSHASIWIETIIKYEKIKRKFKS